MLKNSKFKTLVLAFYFTSLPYSANSISVKSLLNSTVSVMSRFYNYLWSFSNKENQEDFIKHSEVFQSVPQQETNSEIFGFTEDRLEETFQYEVPNTESNKNSKKEIILLETSQYGALDEIAPVMLKQDYSEEDRKLEALLSHYVVAQNRYEFVSELIKNNRGILETLKKSKIENSNLVDLQDEIEYVIEINRLLNNYSKNNDNTKVFAHYGYQQQDLFNQQVIKYMESIDDKDQNRINFLQALKSFRDQKYKQLNSEEECENW